MLFLGVGSQGRPRDFCEIIEWLYLRSAPGLVDEL